MTNESPEYLERLNPRLHDDSHAAMTTYADHFSNRRHWFRWAGGPLLIVSDRHAEQWAGVFGTGSIRVRPAKVLEDGWSERSDYARACAINALVGGIDVSGAEAVIVRWHELAAAWHVRSPDELWLVLVDYVGSEADVDRAIESLNESDFVDAGAALQHSGNAIVLMAAADDGASTPDRQAVPGNPGRLLASVASFEDDTTSVTTVRFRRATSTT